MSIMLHCPVCDDEFSWSCSWNNIDSCGESNSNICLDGECPECGYHVIADFHYQDQWSKNLMDDMNEDKFEARYITKKVQTTEKVLVKKGTPPLPNQECGECAETTTLAEHEGMQLCLKCINAYEGAVIE